jgi:hypothetical protein
MAVDLVVDEGLVRALAEAWLGVEAMEAVSAGVHFPLVGEGGKIPFWKISAHPEIGCFWIDIN